MLVVGDVHGMWDDVDRAFVEGGDQDVVIFVGDIGDEHVALVGAIARLECKKVVILGNHDAWNGMRRDGGLGRVHEQLELLGDAHLAYRSWRAPAGDVALIGARPFSWGGGWKTWRRFYEPLYEVSTNDDSADRLVAAARTVPDLPLVVVAHNGPKGLGEGADAIYGCDFRKPHIDFGDPDLKLALGRLAHEEKRRVVASIAGHMHHRLRDGGLRRRALVQDDTVHLNAAVVPRHQRVAASGLLRHFMRVHVAAGGVVDATDIWVDDRADIVVEARVFDAAQPDADLRPGSPRESRLAP